MIPFCCGDVCATQPNIHLIAQRCIWNGRCENLMPEIQVPCLSSVRLVHSLKNGDFVLLRVCFEGMSRNLGTKLSFLTTEKVFTMTTATTMAATTRVELALCLEEGGGGTAKTGSLSLPSLSLSRSCRSMLSRFDNFVLEERRVWSGDQLGSYACSYFAF